MARGGLLRASLNAQKGVNYGLERQKKLRKAAEKRKRIQAEHETEEFREFEEEVGIEDAEVEVGDAGVSEDEDVDLAQIDDTSDSDSSDSVQDEEEEGEEEEEEGGGGGGGGRGDAGGGVPLLTGLNGKPSDADLENDEPEEDEEDEDIPFSDIASLDSEQRGDVVTFQRLTINNHAALTASLKRIAIPSKAPFSAHMSVTTAEPVIIQDVDDDLNRELAFYAQALAAAKDSRTRLKSEGVPFTRPNDYFAEMVKSEEHMGRVKQRLIDDAAAKKASSDARRQRHLKKFGKAVQVSRMQERDKEKRETLEKINTLKRKRSNALPMAETEADMFDIALDTEMKAPKMNSIGDKVGSNRKRQKKNEKYGFGGKKRHGKSGDAMSSSDLRDFSVKKMKGRTKGSKPRLGKSKRAKARP